MKTCEWCGEEYEGAGHKGSCSKKCWDEENPQKCGWCDEEYEGSGYRGTDLCSKQCWTEGKAEHDFEMMRESRLFGEE